MLKKGLGRGLSALLPDAEPRVEPSPRLLPIESISPSPLQPRRSFDDERIEELAASMREKGIIQPLVVRRGATGYELIAGERRLRAAMRAGLKEVPVVFKEASDPEALELALIENLQREDLNSIEEASAYLRLKEDFGLSQEEIAEKVGKSRPAVANSLRLLLLPKDLQEEVSRGRLPAGQARALLGLEREALLRAAARQVISKGLSTRATERLVQRLKSGKQGKALVADPDMRALIEKLQRSLGTRVRLIHQRRSGRGKIVIEYYSAADLRRLVEMLAANH